MSKKKKNKKRKAPASDGENAPPKLDSSKEDEPKLDDNKEISPTLGEAGVGLRGIVGKVVAWSIFAIFLLLFVVEPMAFPPKVKKGFDYLAFGRLPVLLDGRIKPMDTVARNSLLQIAGQQKIALDGNGPNKEWGDLYDLSQKGNGEGLTHRKSYQKFYKRPRKLHPTEWLMEVMMKPDVADKRFIFRVDHPELLSELQLAKVGVDKSGLRYYTFEQMKPFVVSLHGKRRVIGNKKAVNRTPYEKAAYKLANALELYIQLRSSLQPNRLDLGNEANSESAGFADYAGHLLQLEQKGADNADAYRAFVSSHPGESSTFAGLFHELRRFGDVTQADLDNPDPSHLVIKVQDRFKRLQTVSQERLPQMPDSSRRHFLRINQAIESYLALDEPEQAKLARHLLTVESPLQNMKIRSNLHMIPEVTDGPEWDALQWMQPVIDIMKDEKDARRLPQGLGHWNKSKWSEMLDLVIVQIKNSKLADPTEGAWTDDDAKTVKEFVIKQIRARQLKSPDPDWESFIWHKTADSILAGIPNKKLDAPVHRFAEMSSAYVGGKPEDFWEAIKKHTDWLQGNFFAKEMKKGKAEHYYNTFAPFARAQGIYVIALLLACFSWLRMSRVLMDTAFYLIGLAFLLHTAGLAFRMYLEGRPPVTNLYSSAVFVGWGAVILGWIVECIYRKGIGSCVAALVGFSTLIIAGALSEEGDTMAKLVAVLDTNFWLATHVVCITLGYSATFLAGFLGMIYVLRGVFTPSLTNETAKSLARMVYGIVCFATIFSFVGTVLGGIWADQSWGRFWGWDPKENGALLIVVWNAIILHCRWGGIVRDRGLMNLAIFGNIVTAWSWFGVNMLGSGLHSYGFMDGAFHALEWFAVGQVLLILAAVQPLRHWLSGRHIAKEFNCTIAIIVAVLMGLGIMLHVGSLWGSGFLSYLGLALVCAGLLLSFLPSRVVGTTEKRAA